MQQAVPKDYRELLAEIKDITTADGFVSSCLEIKESLYFYEIDLLLAAYTASFEVLATAVLLDAAIVGQQELLQAQEEVESCLNTLLVDLGKYHFPLDIQYVVDRFMQGAAPRLRLRLPVYIEMVKAYTSLDTPAEREDLDRLLRQAHRVLGQEKGDAKLVQVLGQVGARMLRGASLRPIWMQVSHPRIQITLSGLQTLMNNLRVTPYVNYPLEELAVERQKRRKVEGNVVVDLRMFRNSRQMGYGFTELNLPFERDEYDNFLDGFFIGFQNVEIEPDEKAADLISSILEVRAVNPGIDSFFILRLMVYCNRWKLSQVSYAVLRILAELDWDDPLFLEAWTLLKSFGGRALPAMRRFARENPRSSLLPYLALFLSNGPPSKRRWSLLKEIFERYPDEAQDKAQIALSIARYGGEDAVAFLEQALTSHKLDGSFRRELERALEEAKRQIVN